MASNETKRLKPQVIQEDIAALEAIREMEGYTSARPEYALTALNAKYTAMTAKQGDETVKEGIAKGARDAANAAEWAFHNAVLGGKGQVKATFGENSDELQSVGLKKKSEYKKPKGGATPPPA